MPSYEIPIKIKLTTDDGSQFTVEPQGFTDTGVWMEWKAQQLLPFRSVVRLEFVTDTAPHLTTDFEVVLSHDSVVGVECKDENFADVLNKWARNEPATVTEDLASIDLQPLATADLMSVLVVEDEPGIAYMLQTALSRRGYDVVCARDVPTARAIFERRAVGAILLDWMLPKVSGGALLEELKQKHPGIPIAVISGVASLESTRQQMKKHGADAIFSKPFAMGELIMWVQSKMGR